MVLNWPMFRSRGVSRLRDTTVRSRVPGDGNISPWCVPGRQSVASFALHVSQKVPRTGKAPLPGNISPPCIQNELTLARFARHVSEMPCKSPFGNTPREDLATKGIFSLHRPLESCTTRESCHSWVFRLGVAGEVRGEAGRGVPAQRMRLAHAPPLCARRRGAFAGSSHAALSCPRSRARCSCCCACSRVRRARCPRVRCAYIPRRPPRGASAFASRRWVCPASPSTRLLSCAFASRRRALLIWLGFRMRPALASLSSRPRRGRNSGIVSFAAENMAL